MPFDFDAAVSAPFRMQPGLRRLAREEPILTPTGRPGGVQHHLLAKLEVLADHAEQALLSQAGFDPRPAWLAWMQRAATEHADALSYDAMGLHAHHLGWSVLDNGGIRLHPGTPWPAVGDVLAKLAPEQRTGALLALSFEQDFAIIDAHTGTIPWLAVCLPSHWAPETKVGRSFAEIHAPVADNRLLVQASQHLMHMVTRPERWERFVWTITHHPALSGHPDRVASIRWPSAWSPDTLAANAHWRTEHQSFIAVPGMDQAVFTIHVQVQPLVGALNPAQANAVHQALESMSPAVLAYRGLTDARDRLLKWLAHVALDPPSSNQAKNLS